MEDTRPLFVQYEFGWFGSRKKTRHLLLNASGSNGGSRYPEAPSSRASEIASDRRDSAMTTTGNLGWVFCSSRSTSRLPCTPRFRFIKTPSIGFVVRSLKARCESPDRPVFSPTASKPIARSQAHMATRRSWSCSMIRMLLCFLGRDMAFNQLHRTVFRESHLLNGSCSDSSASGDEIVRSSDPCHLASIVRSGRQMIMQLALYDPIQEDERIDNFSTVEAQPPVILPSSRHFLPALEMRAELQSAASIASHGAPRYM